jgi:hypothetical protein
MATIFWMNKEIARGMVCFFHQKKHSYLIFYSKKLYAISWVEIFNNAGVVTRSRRIGSWSSQLGRTNQVRTNVADPQPRASLNSDHTALTGCKKVIWQPSEINLQKLKRCWMQIMRLNASVMRSNFNQKPILRFLNLGYIVLKIGKKYFIYSYKRAMLFVALYVCIFYDAGVVTRDCT